MIAEPERCSLPTGSCRGQASSPARGFGFLFLFFSVLFFKRGEPFIAVWLASGPCTVRAVRGGERGPVVNRGHASMI